MTQISAVLRNTNEGFAHWCPGCNESHWINTKREGSPRWTFDGNVDMPTFNPSIKITGKEINRDVNGEWDGTWKRVALGDAIDYCCHYFIHGGKIQFCGDSTHELSGKTVDLPVWPQEKEP